MLMKNKKALYNLTHGMYILATDGAACFVDAVCQISSGDNPLVSVAVMKKNYTNEVMHKNDKFSISIFGMNDNPELIKTFGLNSMRDINKFEYAKTEVIEGAIVVKDTLGYLVLEKIDTIENDTHTVFIGRVIEADITMDELPMSYNYYQAHKNDLIKVQTERNKTAWVCTICGFVYYGDELPDDFKCPICFADKSAFEKKQ